MSKDYYSILDVEEDATMEEIKESYREKVKEYHPDSSSEKSDKKKFMEVVDAYNTLGGKENREMYDNFGITSDDSSGLPLEPLSRIAESIRSYFSPPDRDIDKDIILSLDINLEQISDREVQIAVDRKKRCGYCGGDGRAGGRMINCFRCNGSGNISREIQTVTGLQTMDVKCPVCEGGGSISCKECYKCGGKGLISSREQIEVDLLEAVKNNGKIVKVGGGHEDRSGNAGNLHVKLDFDGESSS